MKRRRRGQAASSVRLEQTCDKLTILKHPKGNRARSPEPQGLLYLENEQSPALDPRSCCSRFVLRAISACGCLKSHCLLNRHQLTRTPNDSGRRSCRFHQISLLSTVDISAFANMVRKTIDPTNPIVSQTLCDAIDRDVLLARKLR